MSASAANPDHSDRRKLIPAKLLGKMLDRELSILDLQSKELVINELERRGILLGSDAAAYYLDQIHGQLVRLVGTDAASLLVENMKKTM